MGYLFLGLALMAGLIKGYCGKRTSGYTDGFRDAMSANLLRMLFCIVIGFLVLMLGGEWKGLIVTPTVLVISALSGVATSFFVVSWLVSVKKGAYMMLDVFLMTGVLLPMLGGTVFFDEHITWGGMLGVGLLILSAIILCLYNNSIKKDKLTARSFLLLVLCGVANGVADFSQKWFVRASDNGSVAVFNFYTYVFSALTLAVLYAVMTRKTWREESPQGEPSSIKKILPYVAVMAICLFANSYFKTAAAGYLDASVLYPLNQGLALALSSIMVAVFFREKLTPTCIGGLSLTAIGLLLIRFL